jgi:hypothetical protein
MPSHRADASAAFAHPTSPHAQREKIASLRLAMTRSENEQG